MKKKKARVWAARFSNKSVLLIFSALVLLSGCVEKNTPDNLSASRSLNRIISAAPSNTEIIAGLGLADRLIAVDKYSRNIEGVRKDLPEIDFFYPDIEAIAGLKPDIIVLGEINTNGNAETPYQFFRQLGIRVIEIPTSSSIEEIYDSILLIAQALDAAEKGEELTRRMREQIETIAASVNATGQTAYKKSVYFEIAPAPVIVSFGRGTYLNELIELLGAENIFAAEKRWFTPGPEAIIRANPDVIFILVDKNTAPAAAIAELKNRPGFTTLTAVRQNKIYPVNADNASRPSQNIVPALEEMYRALNTLPTIQ